MADPDNAAIPSPERLQAFIQNAVREALASAFPPPIQVPEIHSSKADGFLGSRDSKSRGPGKRPRKEASHAMAKKPKRALIPATSGAAFDTSYLEEDDAYGPSALIDTMGEPWSTSPNVILDCNGEAFFDPELIRNPSSAEWSPPDHIAKYLQRWLRTSLDKEVRNCLRAECPRPTIPGKVSNTPDFDQFMATYLNSQGPDPRKGIEKGLRAAQDKLLDVSGPLTQIFVLADEAVTQGTPLDPSLIRDWVQRCICLLGNANVAISSERRRAALLRIDPHLSCMADKDFGPAADGMLFGEPFIAELNKHVALYTSLNEVETSLRTIFQPSSVFHGAGRQRRRRNNRGSSGFRPQYNNSSSFSFTSSRGSFRGRRGAGRRRGKNV